MFKNKKKLLLLIYLFSTVTIPIALSDDISLVSHSGYIDLSGNYHVVGEVQNIGSSTYKLVTVTIDFFDADDEIIATRFDLILLDVLLPARKSPFNVMLLDQALSSSVDGYAISITQQTRAPLTKKLRITEHNWYTDEIGEKHVTGSITNEATNPAQDVKIVATFFDGSGDVSAAAFTYIDADENTLQPGELANFEIILDIQRSFYSTSYSITTESTAYSEIKAEEDPPPEPPTPEPEPDPEPDPADIQVVTLSVSPSEIFTDSVIIVNVTAENIGSLSGGKQIILEIDSMEVDAKGVTLNPGESTMLIFTVNTTYDVGLHEIQVGEKNHTIEILPANLKPPTIMLPQPSSEEKNVRINITKLDFTVIDEDSDELNISVTTFPYFGELEAVNYPIGTYSIPVENELEWNTTYTWTINIFDGKYEANASYKFTTKEESLPPIITNEYPADTSPNITETLLALKFSLDDPNNDRMTYFISINPGDYNTKGLTLKEGEQSVLLPIILVNNTQYTWWLNVTDQKLWINESYSFTTYFPRDEDLDTSPELAIKGDKIMLTLLLVTILGVVGYLVLNIKQLFRS